MWSKQYPGLEVVLIPFEDNIFYVLVHDEAALVVDPPVSTLVADLLRERDIPLRAILITHGDGDHIEGVDDLLREWDAPVYAPAGSHVDFDFRPVRDGEVLPLNGLTFRVLDTRGHRVAHAAYYLPQPAPGLLFSGDSLFAGGCGRIFGNPPEWMFATLQKLAELPPETHLYCGHDYLEDNLLFALSVEPHNVAMQRRLEEVRISHRTGKAVLPSTLSLERETNPFLRVSSVEAFAALRRAKDQF